MKGAENGITFKKAAAVLYPMAFKCSPVFFLASAMLLVYMGLSTYFMMFVIRKFFDMLTIGITGSRIFWYGGMVMVLLVLEQAANSAMKVVIEGFAMRLEGYLHYKVQEKVESYDAVDFEDSVFLDEINKAEKGCGAAFGIVYILSSLLFMYIPYFTFVCIYLFQIKPVLLCTIVFLLVPTCIAQILKMKVFGRLENRMGSIRRRMDYYEACICDRPFFKETRKLGAFSYFWDKYKKSFKEYFEGNWEAEKKAGKLEAAINLLNAAGYGGVVTLIIILVIKGSISVGVFAAVLASIDSMSALIQEMIAIHIGGITREIGAVQNLVKLFKTENTQGKDIPDFSKGIQISGVTFTYPGAEKPVIHNLNLSVLPGQTLAIVGENGAGKSTLCKLISGIYKPLNGSVFIGGTDSRKLKVGSGISAVFQKYQRYPFTLKRNINISELSRPIQDGWIKETLSELGIKEIFWNQMVEGENTMLSKEFGGTDLSLGQWQRVAIARGIHRIHEFLILDEPTAAIDPVEESSLYYTFANLAKEKTAIIVTHRLGAARLADRILVIDKGMIVEDGSHEELMKKNGKYAEMFNAQAEWYI